MESFNFISTNNKQRLCLTLLTASLQLFIKTCLIMCFPVVVSRRRKARKKISASSNQNWQIAEGCNVTMINSSKSELKRVILLNVIFPIKMTPVQEVLSWNQGVGRYFLSQVFPSKFQLQQVSSNFNFASTSFFSR